MHILKPETFQMLITWVLGDKMSYSNRAGNKSVMAQSLQALVFPLHYALNGLAQFSLFHDVLSRSHNSPLSHKENGCEKM